MSPTCLLIFAPGPCRTIEEESGGSDVSAIEAGREQLIAENAAASAAPGLDRVFARRGR